MTVGTTLTGAGALTHSATGILNIGGTSTITTLTATLPVLMSVAGNATIASGTTLTIGTNGDLSVGGNLTVDNGGTLTVN